ncbi:hypothetical protein E8E13_003561 [Curvularia kusanoi]|uniref:MT-A70-domain-containing protein n=1 Tax=Curvularia kusanoi TaxID=90978 RepID=A0A9P4WCT6_CURKU|nr:hypothetical protein E8E13_003561 [Curvularia kusanoi]
MLHNQRSAILYQSADREITLIDIPLSIALAQGRTDTLLSTPPLQTPIQTKEEHQQKSSKTKTAQWTDTTHHEIYKPLISQALLDIKAHVSGSWCLPRKILPTDKKDAEKELEHHFREWAAAHSEEANTLSPSLDFQAMMASLGAPDAQPVQNSVQWSMTTSPANTTFSQPSTTSPWTPSFYNASPTHLHLSLSHPTTPTTPHTFTLPPFSAYTLTNCDHPDTFRTTFRALTLTHSLPRTFPLILLDPPWPNRSAKRKHAYEQIGGMPYLKRLLLRMDIDEYLAPGGIVGVWITNKVGVRENGS